MKNIFMGLLFGLCVFHSGLSVSALPASVSSMPGSPFGGGQGFTAMSEFSPGNPFSGGGEWSQMRDGDEHAEAPKLSVMLAKVCGLTVPVQDLPLAYFGKKDVPLKFQQQLSRLFELVKEADSRVNRVPGAYFAELVEFILTNVQLVTHVIETHQGEFADQIAQDWSFLGKTNVNLNFVNDLRKFCEENGEGLPPFSISGLVDCIIHNEHALFDAVRQFQEEQRRQLSEESAATQTSTLSPTEEAEKFVDATDDEGMHTSPNDD